MSAQTTNVPKTNPKAPMRLRLYHGTNAKFTAFDNRFLGSANGTAPINRTGFNFTDSKELAKTFGKILLTVDLEFKNPLVLDAKGKGYAEFKHTLNARLEKLDRSKHDAVVIKNYADCGVHGDADVLGSHVVVLSPSQVNIVSRERSAGLGR